MMSLEGLVSEIGCGVLSEGKAEGVDSTEGARVWHARLRIGGACGHGGGLLFGLRFTTAAKKTYQLKNYYPTSNTSRPTDTLWVVGQLRMFQ